MEVMYMTKFQAFKLRMSLLKIWALKNVSVFLEVAIFIIVILVLTGQVTSDTPILGLIPGVDSLTTAIHSFLNDLELNSEFWTKLAGSVLSLFIAIGTLSGGLRRVALKDIKNPKLKRALIQAGLYFNKDGKLVKRIEETIKIDLDGDNKIGDTEESINSTEQERLVPGVKRAFEELGTIMSVKIDTFEQAQKIKEEQGLIETEKALDAVKAEIESSAALTSLTLTKETKKIKVNIMKRMFLTMGSGIKKVTIGTGRFFKRTGIAISGFFVKIFNGIKGIFKKKPKKVKKIIKKDIKVEAVKPAVVVVKPAVVVVKPAATPVVQKPVVQSSSSSILSRIKNNGKR